jgi:hypothetical protein
MTRMVFNALLRFVGISKFVSIDFKRKEAYNSIMLKIVCSSLARHLPLNSGWTNTRPQSTDVFAIEYSEGFVN